MILAGYLAAGLGWPAPGAPPQPLPDEAAWLRCTREPEVLAALRIMRRIPDAQAALDWVTRRPSRIVFRNLAELDPAVRRFDAVSWMSPTGQPMIYINQRHRSAPPEALAALLSHEAMHQDTDNSMTEEAAGWQMEAIVWRRLTQERPGLAAMPVKAFPLVGRLNQLVALEAQGRIADTVRQNPSYQGLPETSPGFPPAAAQVALPEPGG